MDNLHMGIDKNYDQDQVFLLSFSWLCSLLSINY